MVRLGTFDRRTRNKYQTTFWILTEHLFFNSFYYRPSINHLMLRRSREVWQKNHKITSGREESCKATSVFIFWKPTTDYLKKSNIFQKKIQKFYEFYASPRGREGANNPWKAPNWLWDATLIHGPRSSSPRWRKHDLSK